MNCDNISPPGSWREEILRGPATTSQLRDIIAELEQSLRLANADRASLRDQNSKLVIQLTEAVASEMEARSQVARLKKEITQLWTTLRNN